MAEDGQLGFHGRLLPGAARLLAAHARELPQRDDLCGAFCGALALEAILPRAAWPQPLDQDTVALAAGSVVSELAQPGILPDGEEGRRDYRLPLPRTIGEEESGTSAAGVVHALRALGGEAIEVLALAGPWTGASVTAIFELALACEQPVSLIANLHTSYLWGSHPTVPTVLGLLGRGLDEGPPADWSVGHFVCIVGRIEGPQGQLYMLADTYPALGDRGVHLQPLARLASALARPAHPAGGLIVACASADGERIRSGAQATGLLEGLWDNGSRPLPGEEHRGVES